MTPAEQDLARELAEHPAWRWAAGMRVCSPDGWARVDDDRLDEWEGWPDLADPATQGCLAAALEPWILDVSRRRYMSDVRWTVTVFLSGRKEHSSAPTFGEAIARAWLAMQRDARPDAG